MPEEKGRLLGSKMLDVHSMMLRWSSENLDHCFDINGKKPDTLTRTQMELLKTIHTLGKTTISQLERVMFTSKSSLSITISRMVKDGYVERYKEDKDGRITYLRVTPKAMETMKKTFEQMLKGFGAYYDSLSVENKEWLETGVDCFYKILKTQEEERQ